MGKYDTCKSRKVFMGPPVSIGICTSKRHHEDDHRDSKGRTWNDDRNHRS
uniref:HNH endonuclease n=1 Tax=Micrococcus phage Kurnik TaxID=3092208 RepID=A0AAU6R5F8_9CAUD